MTKSLQIRKVWTGNSKRTKCWCYP